MQNKHFSMKTNLICKATNEPVIIVSAGINSWDHFRVMYSDGREAILKGDEDFIVLSRPVTWGGIEAMKESIIRHLWSLTPIEHSIEGDINNDRLRIRNSLTKAIEEL